MPLFFLHLIMTWNEIYQLIISPPQGFKKTFDHRLTEKGIVYEAFLKYRALEIENQERRTGDLMPVWIQEAYVDKVKVKVLNELSKARIGTARIPRLIQFKRRNASHLNKAMHSVFNDCGCEYKPTSKSMMNLIITSSLESSRFDYYFMVGDAIHVYPESTKLQLNGVFYDPMQALIYDQETKLSGELIIGEKYKTIQGSIVHAGSTYQNSNIFTASRADFTGNGIVVPVNDFRLLNGDDEFPINDSMIHFITQQIWTNEFKIATSVPVDEIGTGREEASRPIPGTGGVQGDTQE